MMRETEINGRKKTSLYDEGSSVDRHEPSGVEAVSASGAARRRMGPSHPDPAAIVLGHVFVASLCGYGASVAVFLLLSPVRWILVVSAFVPGALLAVGVLFLMRRLFGGRG